MPKPNPGKKTIVGVTGVYGSGKSTVSRIFGSLGAKVIDADRLARRHLSPGTGVYKRVVRAFGSGILGQDRRINRKRLAEVVFNDRDSLLRLNSIMHPEIIRQIKRGIKNAGEKLVVLDAPLLIEAGLRRAVDKLVVVKATESRRMKRLLAKQALTGEDIKKRVRAQIPLRKKLRYADFIIDNNGMLTQTRRQVRRVWKELNSQTAYKSPAHSRRKLWKS